MTRSNQPSGPRLKRRPLPRPGYPLTKLGRQLFIGVNFDEWTTRLVKHYRENVPFTAEERSLRQEHPQLSPKQGGAILLEWAIEESLRGILGTRKGRNRRRAVSTTVLKQFEYLRVQLVLEAPGRATTMFRHERQQHDVDGIIGVNCTVRHRDGMVYKKVRCRFVSHPFWQLGVSAARNTGGGSQDDEAEEQEEQTDDESDYAE